MVQKGLILLIISSLGIYLLPAQCPDQANARAINPTHNLLHIVTPHTPLQALIVSYLPEFYWAEFEQYQLSDKQLACAALSPNGLFLAHVTREDNSDKKIHLYDTKNKQNIYAFEYENGLTDLAVSDNGEYIAMRAGQDLLIHETKTKKTYVLNRADAGRFNFQPQTNILIISGSRSIGLCDCTTMRTQSIGMFNPFNKQMDYRTGSANTIISSHNYQLNVHKMPGLLFRPLKSTQNQTQALLGMLVAISPTEKYVLQICLEPINTIIKIYDLMQKKEIWSENIHDKIITAAFLADNCFIVVDQNGIIKKWNLYKNSR
jgi:WD40 repeat protein